MKPVILLQLFIFTIMTVACSPGHNQKYDGEWNRIYTSEDTGLGLNIHGDTTEFEVAPNQLAIVCENKYSADTLLLYVKSVDCGRDFSLMFEPPKSNDLFARAYLMKKRLHVLFNKKIVKKYFDVLRLDTVFYRADEISRN